MKFSDKFSFSDLRDLSKGEGIKLRTRYALSSITLSRKRAAIRAHCLRVSTRSSKALDADERRSYATNDYPKIHLSLFLSLSLSPSCAGDRGAHAAAFRPVVKPGGLN